MRYWSWVRSGSGTLAGTTAPPDWPRPTESPVCPSLVKPPRNGDRAGTGSPLAAVTALARMSLARSVASTPPATVCRLRASPGELWRRLTDRGAPDLIAGSLRAAEELDRSSLADVCVGTDGLTVAEVAQLVRERCGGWPPEHATGARAAETALAPLPAAGAGGEVLLVCGAAGVGKSAVGFQVYLRQLRAGLAAARCPRRTSPCAGSMPAPPSWHAASRVAGRASAGQNPATR